MKTSIKVLIVVGIILLLLVVSVVGSYNGLVEKREVVDIALSQIDNQLQRRNDLIPNLVETVKRYASHEEEIFTDIAEARAKLAGAGNISEQAEADAALGGALSRLIAIAENYPNLKANQNFIQLQDELAGTENRIATARRDYNESARIYNTKIRKFPTVIYAGMFGFEKVDYFEASDEARQVPNVGGLFGN
ncbi:LemA family protein [Alkaliphilus transvaalensis]|uniref:LemA family protein n=1 Tax=Alkaliphilus transvaalensis TaxID=114628 RepID=UPI00047ED246|nr:LemA family protein [Alkaliphilus transvaalensis]